MKKKMESFQKEWRFSVSSQEEGMSLLSFLRKKRPQNISVKSIKRAIDSKKCTLNGKVEYFSSHPLLKGDKVVLDSSSLELPKASSLSKMEILYEDEDILICSKPAGIVCEERAINKELPQYKGGLKLVHRLDKDTSGALILVKGERAEKDILSLFFERKIEKQYLAIVDGYVKGKKGKIESFLEKKHVYQGQSIFGSTTKKGEGSYALTHWTCLKATFHASLLLCTPFTGRTHQLRVHLKEIGHPLLGDFQYCSSFSCSLRPERHLLHAYSLFFIHPIKNFSIKVIAPLPQDFVEAKKHLNLCK